MNESPSTQPTVSDLKQNRSIGKGQIARAILLIVTIAVIIVGSLPGYISNNWSWNSFPEVTNFKQVKNVLSKGIKLPDSNTYIRQPTEVGSHRWLVQAIGKTPDNPIVLFLRPQTENPKKLDKFDKPEVDWEDIRGFAKDFNNTPERWIENLTYQILKEKFEEKLNRANPNPSGGDGSEAFKQSFNKDLQPWFEQKFIAAFEQQTQKPFKENFAKPLQDSLGMTFPEWVGKQLESGLELGLSAWIKDRFSQSNSDSERDLNFTATADSRTVAVTARLFRAWNDKQTMAVVQWYARPDGGHYSSASWFWADRSAQLQNRRIPWIAVCLKIPIEPLGDLSKVEEEIKKLAISVQQALMQKAFAGDGGSIESKSSQAK